MDTRSYFTARVVAICKLYERRPRYFCLSFYIMLSLIRSLRGSGTVWSWRGGGEATGREVFGKRAGRLGL